MQVSGYHSRFSSLAFSGVSQRTWAKLLAPLVLSGGLVSCTPSKVTPAPPPVQTSIQLLALQQVSAPVDPTPVFELSPGFREDLKELFIQQTRFFLTQHMQNSMRVISNNYSHNPPYNEKFSQISISEGASYAAERFLRLNKPEEFHRVFTWTVENMKRPKDSLLSWIVGIDKKDGQLKQIAGNDNAVDGDQDFAHAALLASERFHPDRLGINPETSPRLYATYFERSQKYRAQALRMIQDLRRHHVKEAGGKLILTAGAYFDRESGNQWIVNPSYLQPYKYWKDFARTDKEGEKVWQKLAEDCYDLWEDAAKLTSKRLIPDFVAVGKEDGKVTLAPFGQDAAWDACRVLIRLANEIALGDLRFKDRARKLFLPYSFVEDYLKRHHRLPGGFTPNGDPVGPSDQGFWPAGLFAMRSVQDPDNAKKHFQELLLPFYNPAEGSFRDSSNDYLQSVIFNALTPPVLSKDGQVHLISFEPPQVDTPDTGTFDMGPEWKAVLDLLNAQASPSAKQFEYNQIDAAWHAAKTDSTPQMAIGKILYFMREYRKTALLRADYLKLTKVQGDILSVLDNLPQHLGWKRP